MNRIDKQIKMLKEILLAENPVKMDIIKKFQKAVWEDNDVIQNEVSEKLSELAYDMDFYEPNYDLRKESDSYYDDDKLRMLINELLQNLSDDSERGTPFTRLCER